MKRLLLALGVCMIGMLALTACQPAGKLPYVPTVQATATPH